MMFKNINKLYACGDIHGMYKKFIDVFNQVKLEKNDLMVFLGDYIDRGEECLEMMRFVVDNIDNERMVFLKGNHEDLMIEDIALKIKEIYNIETLDVKTFLKYVNERVLTELLDEPSVEYCWVKNGGLTTIEAMLKDIVLAKQFILCALSMEVKIEVEYNGEVIYFSHAGCNARKSERNQEEYDYLWTREDFYREYKGEHKWIVGHTPIQSFNVNELIPLYLTNNIIMCDTGSYLHDGRISIIDLGTNEVFQDNVNEEAPYRWYEYVMPSMKMYNFE